MNKQRGGGICPAVSHNLNVVYQVSDRVGVMYLGRMVEIADYDQLYENNLNNLDETDKVSELQNIPRLNHKERKSEQPIMSEEIRVINNLP